MSNEKLENSDNVHCWSCKQLLQIGDIRNHDGYCPCCDVPIDLDEEPYTYKATPEKSNE